MVTSPMRRPVVPGELTREERATKVIELRRRGLTFQQIGDRLGVTKQRAHEMYTLVMADEQTEQVSAYRAEQAMRLDALSVEAWNVIDRNRLVNDEMVLGAILALTKIEERRAKLYGLDAPAKHAVTVDTVQYQIVGVDPKELQ